MPRRTITSENKIGSGGDRFPQLDFKNKGERKRVMLFQVDASGNAVVWQEYVHFLRMPQFNEDGTVKMTLRESKKDPDEKYEDYDLKFVGRPLCLGDPEVIEANGYDPGNCPVCAKVPDAPAEAKLYPQLALAVNVVEWALQPGTWNIQRPLSPKVVIWRLSPNQYDDIISQQEQHGELLRKQDLTLECTNAVFKNFKLGVMPTPGWKDGGPNGGAILKELLETPGNIATDDQLRDACGRSAKRVFMEEDLAMVLKKWRRAKAAEGDPDDVSGLGGGQLGGGRDLAQEVDRLKQEARAETQARTDDPFAGVGTPGAGKRLQEFADGLPQDVRDTVAQASGLGEFTADGNHQAAAEVAAQEAQAQPAGDDPFAALPSPDTARAATTTSTAAPAAESPSPTEQKPAELAAASEPVPASRPAGDGERKPQSFEDLIKDLGGV